MLDDKLYKFYKKKLSSNLIGLISQLSRLPVVTFAAFGIATPADVIICMSLGWRFCWQWNFYSMLIYLYNKFYIYSFIFIVLYK